MNSWPTVNGLSTNLYNSTKLNIVTIRGNARGFILGTSDFKKLLKIDIFVSLYDNSAHNTELVSRKFSGLLKIIC